MDFEKFTSRLNQIYNRENGNVTQTPAQFQRNIEAQKVIDLVAERTGISDEEVLFQLAMTPSQEFWEVFESWLEFYINKLGVDVASAITPDCIDFQSGNISEKKLNKYLRMYRRGNGKFSY